MGAAAIPLIGGGLSAVGQMQQGRQERWALEDEANTADKNANMAREVGQYNARRQELETNQRVGSIHADVGASGIASDSGSVLDVLRNTAVNAELDRQNILRGSELEARNYNYRANQARYGAKQSKKAEALNVFSTLFGAGAKAASMKGGNGKIDQPESTSVDGMESSRQFRQGNLAYDTSRIS